MRRFPSGATDQYIYFVAVDATDLKARETGLSSFTVYRARNGAAAAAYTTPTVAEVSSSNMPGVYSLLLDEDMTIGSGNDSEEVVLHITQASMAPVTLVFELYREKITQGETLTVSSGSGNAAVQSMANNVLTAAAINADAITAAKVASDVGAEIGTAVWATAARTLTALDEDTTTIDLDATIRAAVGLASANLDTQIGDLPTNAELATALGAADDAVLAQIALVKAKTDNLPSDPADASVIAGRFDTLDTSVADLPTNAELATALAGADDAVLAAIGALTIPSAADTAAAVLAAAFEGAETVQDFLRLSRAALYGQSTGMETTSPAFRDAADTKDRIVVVGADVNGNRPVVTLDPS